MTDKVDFKDMVRIDKRKDGMLSFVLDGNFQFPSQFNAGADRGIIEVYRSARTRRAVLSAIASLSSRYSCMASSAARSRASAFVGGLMR